MVRTHGRTLISTLLAALACGALAVGASARGNMTDDSKPRKGEAKISMKQARSTALARVPGGRVKSSELEREGGKLIYSFDIRPAKGTGIDEVHVDAITGEVLAVDHETPAGEAKERRAERKGRKPKKP
jgi:uncharacterized membrane protein YkoI